MHFQKLTLKLLEIPNAPKIGGNIQAELYIFLTATSITVMTVMML